MKNQIFAKLFEHDVYGQVLVRTTQNEDEIPAIAVRIDIRGRDNTAEFTMGYEDSPERSATDARDEAFDSIGEAEAFELAGNAYKVASPLYTAADAEDND